MEVLDDIKEYDYDAIALYNQTNKEKLAPFYWLNLKEVKIKLKELELKRPKKENEIMIFDKKLFEIYKNYLFSDKEEKLEKVEGKENNIYEFLFANFETDIAQLIVSTFYNEVLGKSVPLITRETNLKPDIVINGLSQKVKSVLFSLVVYLLTVKKFNRHLINTMQITDTIKDYLTKFSDLGIRNSNEAIFVNERVSIFYKNIKIKGN